MLVYISLIKCCYFFWKDVKFVSNKHYFKVSLFLTKFTILCWNKCINHLKKSVFPFTFFHGSWAVKNKSKNIPVTTFSYSWYVQDSKVKGKRIFVEKSWNKKIVFMRKERPSFFSDSCICLDLNGKFHILLDYVTRKK